MTQLPPPVSPTPPVNIVSEMLGVLLKIVPKASEVEARLDLTLKSNRVAICREGVLYNVDVVVYLFKVQRKDQAPSILIVTLYLHVRLEKGPVRRGRENKQGGNGRWESRIQIFKK